MTSPIPLDNIRTDSDQRLLQTAYFFSGAAALLYQTIWQRYVLFSTGVGMMSISLVVASFLAGLGLGYLFGGWLSDRLPHRRILPAFVAIEGGIILFALFSKSLLYDFLGTLPDLGPSAPFRTFAVIFVILLGPTMLMGMSLPILSKAVRRLDMLAQSSQIARLYYWNTFGGGFGVLLTGCLIIPAIGLQSAAWVGAGFNGLCVALAIAALAGTKAVHSRPAPDPETAPAVGSPSRLPSLGWFGHYFLSGFAVISFELLWFRVIDLTVKAHAQTFSLILACFLTAMGLGVVLGDRIRTRLTYERRLRAFLFSQIGLYLSMAVTVVTFLWSVEHVPALRFWFAYLESYELDSTVGLFAVGYILLPLLLLFLPGLMMGLGFSLSQQMVQTEFRIMGRTLGFLLAANLTGSVVGAFAVIFGGFDVLGTGRAMSVLAGFGLVYALVWIGGQRPQALRAAAVVAFLGLAIWAMPASFGLMRILHGMKDPQHLLVMEDAAGVSAIKLYPLESGEKGVVFANGVGQSSLPRTDDRIHVALGAVPVLLHPDPVDIAVIGLGSGSTVWGLSCRPETRSVDCFEIVKNQPEILRQYARRNSDPSAAWFDSDPRIAIVHGDGRHALLRTTKRYDIIEADALRPRSAGSGNLYSIEYFELAKQRLKPGGFLTTWIPTPRVLNTVRSVFDYVVVLEGYIAVGSDRPFQTDWQPVLERIKVKFTSAHFATAGIQAILFIGPCLKNPVAYHGRLQGESEVNTDMFPRDEFANPLGALSRLISRSPSSPPGGRKSAD